MTEDGKSFRQILRSSSIIGGASVVNVAIGMVRTKVVAVVLGTIGVGLIGLLANLMTTASALVGLGLGMAGTRQIAASAAGKEGSALTTSRRALLWGTAVLALFGLALMFFLRDTLATLVLGDHSRSSSVGWLGVGVLLTVASASQGALLTGLRRIGDIARLSIASSALSTGLCLIPILLFGDRGVVAYVIAGPLTSFLLGHYFVSKLERPAEAQVPARAVFREIGELARLGFAMMVASVVSVVALLLVRTIVKRGLSGEDLGYFQSAWALSAIYVGFILTAMGTDFYPRLTGVIGDHKSANTLVNEQTEVALLLSGPILLFSMGFAPWILPLLYSRAFEPAVELWRWQILGDLLKIASWPIGFILLASSDGRTIVLAETAAYAVFILVTLMALEQFGVSAAGIGFLSLYIFYLPLVYWLAHRRTSFSWTARVVKLLAFQLFAAVAMMGLARYSALAGAAAGACIALGLSVHTVRRLSEVGALSGRVARFAKFTRRLNDRITRRPR